MRLLGSLLLIVGLSYYAELFLPWWAVAVVAAFVCALLRVELLQSFMVGFIGVGGLWITLAWMTHRSSEGLLSNKITDLFGLSDPLYLVIATGLVGGLVGGLAAMSGSALRRTFGRPTRRRGPYS